MRKLLWFLFKVLVIAFVAYGVYSYFVPEQELHVVTLDRKEDILHHTSAELEDIIVTESRKNSELIVYEEDLSASQTISKALLDLDLFRKTQTVVSHGTALYTVDLSAIDTDDIAYDETSRVLTVTVPHSTCKTVTVHVEQTEFSDVSRELFGWGDLTLTPEQQNLLQQDLQAHLEEKAGQPDALARADASAREALTELYRKALSPVEPSAVISIAFAE